MKRSSLIWVLAGAGVVVLALWFSLRGAGGTSSSREPREYGALFEQTFEQPEPGESARVPEVAELDPEALSEAERAAELAREEKAEQLRQAAALQISPRPGWPFMQNRLLRLGISAERSKEIEGRLGDYAAALRDRNEGRIPPAKIRLTPEERQARRDLRADYLSDEEYDLALYATLQFNRAVFVSQKPTSPAVEAGIQEGDEVIRLNGMRIFDAADFGDARDSIGVGETHQLEIRSNGELRTIRLPCCKPGWRGVTAKIAEPFLE